MSTEYTQQDIQDALATLPQVLQDAIKRVDIVGNMRALAEKHKLHLDKWSVLEHEIMLALVGLTDPFELPQTLAREANIPIEVAQEIADSTSQLVFNPIHDTLIDELGRSESVVEHVDNEPEQSTPDVSKFSHAPTDPQAYIPKTEKTYPADNDPYHEPIDDDLLPYT